MNRRYAFTLIDSVVLLAIFVIVIGLLAPALNKLVGAAESARARAAVRAGLDAWKNGASLDILQDRAPQVCFHDPDLLNGWRLKSYHLMKDYGFCLGQQRRFCVRLVMHSPNGRQATKDVEYLVETFPAFTVVRADD
jgi:hypothetical protein